MPQLVFTGVKQEDLKIINKDLTNKLSQITGTERDVFTFKLDESKYMFDGELVSPFTLIDIYWFERPRDMQDACAKAITEKLSDLGYEDVEVVFHMLFPDCYYVNGEHL